MPIKPAERKRADFKTRNIKNTLQVKMAKKDREREREQVRVNKRDRGE